MSYRVDIPTLSANEVYTLTFEYGGTETIQLVVGDLTLETTDRRVVFTTTSPVNYIESNVNLTNLNIYEGYYESDDFGGEYTQESYIEGKSLINLMPASSPKTLSQGWSLDFDETTGVATIVFDNNTNGFPCSIRSFGMMKKLKPATYYTYFVEILENSLVDSSGNKPKIMFYNTSAYLYPSTQCPYNTETAKGDCIVGSGAIERCTIKNEASPGKYVWAIKTVDTFVDTMVSADNIFQSVALNGTVKVRMMIVEGDYVDNPIETNWFPQGIGCVKSPRVISREQPLNMFYCTNWTSTLNNGTVTCQDGKFYFDGSFGGYTYFDIINGGKTKNNIYLEPGSYYAKMKAYSKGPCVVSGTCVSLEATMENGITLDLCSVYTSKDKMYNQVTGQNNNFTSPIVKLTLKIWYGGNGSNNIIIDGIYLSKTNTTDDLSFKESHAITTPDNLELYDLYHGTKIEKQDKLDLTTGILTRNVCKWKLNDYLASNLNYWNIREWNKKDETTNEYVKIQVGALGAPNGRPTLARGWSEVYGLYFDYWDTDYGASYFYDGKTYFYVVSGGVFFMCSKAQILSWTGVESYELLTTRHIYDWFVAGDFTMMNALSEPTTEQLSLNPLKSYHNGSIQTSSQQLIPTLKTTLPISNKFTTTNLTSGSTYNVYFDGTATKLDAGGTIITNPVSPCEVECGGTTLTIEGTDIQNVRVIETTIKNEVGSVCGKTDVELSRIKTKCAIHNMFDDYFQGSHNTNWAKDYYCTSTRDDTTVKIVGKSSLNYAGYSLVAPLPFGTYKLHYKVKVSTIGDKYKVALSSNPNGTPQDAYVPVTDVTSTALVEEQTFVFYKKHITNMLFYTYRNGQEIEYYDISLIKLSDEDITGTDTSSINYSQVISDLEQPIKLRSLGTTYDSYNPVTGELTKRIGVSETDGSYSVLSSPVISQAPFGRYFTNIFDINTDMIRNWSTTPTVNGNEITIKGTWYTSFGVPFENGKQYTLFYEMVTNGRMIVLNNYENQDSGIIGTNNNWSSAGTKDVLTFTYKDDDTSTTGGLLFYANPTGTTYKNIMVVEGKYSYDDLPYFEGTQFIKCDIPHLYTNGQVKVYSNSDVYPTTILNGQSTNNYEINELNKSNNYTIRYDGTCESINLANKSNEQGNNVLVKAGATSGNLTFVNSGGDIDNVLLVQNDVREQEINHFNGLQTVEISQLQISPNGVDYIFTPKNKDNMIMLDGTNGSINDDNSITLKHTGANSNLGFISQRIYTFKPNDKILIRISGMNNTAWTYFLRGYVGDKVLFTIQAEDKEAIVDENGYLDVYATYTNTEVITGMLRIMNYYGEWTISHICVCEQDNLEVLEPTIIDLPQPVQLNSLPDGTCDTYNPITGEYVQNVGVAIMDENGTYGNNWSNTGTAYPVSRCTGFTIGDMATRNSTVTNVLNNVHSANYGTAKDYEVKLCGYGDRNTNYSPVIDCGNLLTDGKNNINGLKAFLKENPIILYYQLVTPITTQLTPINIPTFEGGTLQLVTTDGKVFPMIEYSMPTNNRYDTSSWEAGAVYTQRNMTEVYFNDSTTPMTPTETTTLTTDHISSGSIILNDNGNGLIVLKGNYTGRDIPYFTGMRSVESIEIETTPSPDQPLFGKGGRR